MNYVKCLLFIILLIGISSPLSTVVSEEANPKNPSAKNQKKGEIPLVDVEEVSVHPLTVGEKLTYNVKLGWIPAGNRVDHIEKKMVIDGKSILQIRSEAKTSGVASRIHRFQNRQFTFLNTVGFYPLRFRNLLEDKKYSAIVEINFYEGEAAYEKTSQNSEKEPKKHEKKVLDIPFGTQDELSMIYFLRCKKLIPGKTYFFPLISKAKVVKISISVERGEVLKIKGLGQVRTLVVCTSHGYRLWLTDDPRHIPVKIEAEIKLGKMKANLKKIEGIR